MFTSNENLTFGILDIIPSKHRDGTFHVNKRPFGALSYRISGASEIRIQNKSFHILPGDVFFLPALTDYDAEYRGSNSIVIHITDCGYTKADLYRPSDTELFKSLFYEMIYNWEQEHSVNRAKAQIYEILYRIEKCKRSSDNSLIDRALSYVEDNLFDPQLQVTNICEHLYTSPSTLQRSFIAALGMSPKQYILKKRMDKATELLIKNELSVKQIAHTCGFSDEKYFSTAFLRKYGCQPSRFRDSMFV